MMSSPIQEAERQALSSVNKQRRKRSFEGNYDSINAVEKRCRIQQDTQEANGRMMCPYYMRNSRKSEIKPSCFVTGFAEIAKLRDHLKNVHHIPEDLQSKLNFRSEPFRSLKDKDSKWKRAFQILFPEIPKNEIPSPRLSLETPLAAVHSETDEITLDFNAFRHLLENQFWAEYGNETTVPIVEFMQRFSHNFVDIGKMWLGLSSDSHIGSTTSVRHFQTILDDPPPVMNTAPDLSPCSFDESDPSSPSEFSHDEGCGNQVISQGDGSKDYAAPAGENIKLDELLPESHGSELLATSKSPEPVTPSDDMLLERADGPVTFKKEPHELTLADCSAFPATPKSFDNSCDGLTTYGCGDSLDSSALSSSYCNESKPLDCDSNIWETEVVTSDTMKDCLELTMDGFVNIDILSWSACELVDSWTDFMDSPSMFT